MAKAEAAAAVDAVAARWLGCEFSPEIGLHYEPARLLAGGSQWKVKDRQWKVKDRQWKVKERQWKVKERQWKVKERQCSDLRVVAKRRTNRLRQRPAQPGRVRMCRTEP